MRLMIVLCTFAIQGFAPDAAGADEPEILKRIQSRHEWVHRCISPAVVAVQCRGSGSGFYGTGVMIAPEGLVLTSSTVVPAGSHSVQVFFPDGRVMDAKVIGTDSGTEACVLQVTLKAEDANIALPFLELRDSSKVAVGELAYTAGNPFHTISRDGQVAWSVGTISGQYKISSADKHSRYRGLVLETDAAVNPGSDGGPLLDRNGRLLGILSLCFCESRWLGTAIPVHLIKSAFSTLLRDVPLRDHGDPARIEQSVTVCATGQDKDISTHETCDIAQAMPEQLTLVSHTAKHAIVKIWVKRTEPNGTEIFDRHVLLSQRLRRRPDAPVTGVIYDSKGYIVTSAFNVDGDVTSLNVQLSDTCETGPEKGHLFPAKLLGRHLGLDIAVLKIHPLPGKILPSLELESRPDLKAGRFVAILGSSEEGPIPTHTVGIVSALGRLDGAVTQTDALVNYGNSGGPVMDLRGRFIGIACHLRTHNDWSQLNSGVGFFATSDKIITSLRDLEESRDIKVPPRPFLGVSPSDTAMEGRGVKLEDVKPGSAAASAQLQAGDVIIALDGMDTNSWTALVRIIKAHKPGDTIDMTYQRGSVTRRTQTTLAARDGE